MKDKSPYDRILRVGNGLDYTHFGLRVTEHKNDQSGLTNFNMVGDE